MSDDRVLTMWCLGCGAQRQPWELMKECPACKNEGAYFTYEDMEGNVFQPVHDLNNDDV